MTDRCCHTSFSLIPLMNIHWCKSDVTNQSALFSFSRSLFSSPLSRLAQTGNFTCFLSLSPIDEKREEGKVFCPVFFLFFSHFSFLIYHQSLTVTALAERPALEERKDLRAHAFFVFFSCSHRFVVRRAAQLALPISYWLDRSSLTEWILINYYDRMHLFFFSFFFNYVYLDLLFSIDTHTPRHSSIHKNNIEFDI